LRKIKTFASLINERFQWSPLLHLQVYVSEQDESCKPHGLINDLLSLSYISDINQSFALVI
jgi:hypothetical protein